MDEMILRIRPDGSVAVEETENGTRTYKEISPDSLLKCIKNSARKGKAASGQLPRNCLSFTAWEDGSKAACVLFPDGSADMAFMGTEYRGFPLPPLAFRFKIESDGRVSGAWVKALVGGGWPKPCSKTYRWPFPNASENGLLCLGGNPLPSCAEMRALDSLPRLILAMPHNLDSFSPGNNRRGLEARELFEALKGAPRSFYGESVLMPDGGTLRDFMET